MRYRTHTLSGPWQVSLLLVAASAVWACTAPDTQTARSGDGSDSRWNTTYPDTTYPDQRLVTPVNELPNPYERIHPWAELPWGPFEAGDYDSRASFIGVGQGPDGAIYALSRCSQNSCTGSENPAVLKLDLEGNLLDSWGEGMFDFPHGFYIGPQGNIWTTDTRAHRVLKFSAEGELLMELGERGVIGDPPTHFTQPSAVAVAQNGDVFVAEGHSNNDPDLPNRVTKWSPDGSFIMSFGRYGSGPGEFITPHTLAFDSQGRLFVGDRHNNRIQIFDQDGNFIDLWYQFGRPSGIAITPDDRIYVADSESWDFHNPGWRKGIRIGSARDGTVEFFIEDTESTTISHSGAEGVGVDSEGNVYGAVVRRRMLEKHTPRL